MPSTSETRATGQLFFNTAIEAARQGVEFFRDVFNLPGADVNAESYFSDGNLIHSLIREIPDSELVPLLQVLVDNNVNLESESITGTPVFKAALYRKKETLRFLILNKVKAFGVNKSILVEAIPLVEPDSILHTMEIFKMLVEELSIPIDSKDQYGRTALQQAAEHSYFFIIEYLLDKGAKMIAFPLATAYQEQIDMNEFLRTNVKGYKENIDACFKAIFDAAYRHFFNLVYNTNMSAEAFQRNYFRKFVDEACQQYPYDCHQSEKNIFIKYLNDNLGDKVFRDVAVAKKEYEQRFTFCLGFLPPNNSQMASPIYSASRNTLFERSLIKEIFNYTHEIPSIPNLLKQSK